MSDLLSLKRDFCEIVKRTQPWILSHFVMWLDLKVSEYKVFGYMLLEQGIESYPENQARGVHMTGCSPSKPVSAASPDDVGRCPSDHPASCVIVPKSCLSTSPCTNSRRPSEVYVSATPIFKRQTQQCRVNRRKQQHTHRRSPTALLSMLSGDIHNAVCSLDNHTEEFWGDISQEGDDVSLSEPCLTIKVESTVGSDNAILEIQSVESIHDTDTNGSKKENTRDLKSVDSDCSSRSRNEGEDMNAIQVVSSRYERTLVGGQAIHDDKASEHPRKDSMFNYDASRKSNTEGSIPMTLFLDKSDKSSLKCTSFLSDSVTPNTIPSRSSDVGKSTEWHKTQVKKESTMDSLVIKLEPVDTLSIDSSMDSPRVGNRSSDLGPLFQDHQFAYGPGTRVRTVPDSDVNGRDLMANSFTQLVNNKRELHAETGKAQPSSIESRYTSHRRSRMSMTVPTGSDPSLTCNLCRATFKFKSSLSRHRALHGEKRYHCFVCPKAFHRREHLLLHLQRHSSSTLIACPVCSMEASSVGHLEEHYRLNHGAFIRTAAPPYISKDQSGQCTTD